ncbi:MAG: M1 family metallopeptidase [Ignavibacteriaceae bacterium]
MKISLWLILIFSFFYINPYAQNQLYMPRNIIKAYETGTRSSDGNPGDNYWQNSAAYNIEASFDPHTALLTGSEIISYQNNSPDTLDEIIIRLYANVFRKGNLRDFTLSPESITDGIIIKKFVADTTSYDPDNREEIMIYSTNMIVKLKNPVSPGAKIRMQTEWEIKFPESSFPRGGRYDSTSYFIPYWYPQVAVYDDIDGWDRNEYSGITETYNEFADYDVKITVPPKFVVWATGELVNAKNILTPKFYERLTNAQRNNSFVRIIDKIDYDSGNVFNNPDEEITWHFKASNVPDFAFGASDHYIWDGVSTIADSTTGRLVFISAAYKPESADFYDVTFLAKRSIDFFSSEMPGVPYPYPAMTVFNGSGGMEFPMIVNNGSTDNIASTVGVTSHEIAHTYFPFYMGINERKYAWMDEGWAVFLPFTIQERLAPGNDPKTRSIALYERFAGMEQELPLIITSNNLKGFTYRTASYGRSAAAYLILQNILGEDLFSKCLKEFISRWNGKHPIPYDFFFTFNEISGQNLNWFWNSWFFDFGYPDLAIKEVKEDGENIVISVVKKGRLPVPVSINISGEDNYSEIINRNAAVWKDDNDEIDIEFKVPEGVVITTIELGNKHLPDSDRTNNIFRFNVKK